MLNKKSIKSRMFLFIRAALIVSVVVNLIITLIIVLQDKTITSTELKVEIMKRLDFIFWGVITFFLSFGSDYIEKKEHIDIPDILEIVIVIFIYAGLFLSARFNLYYRFFWWDDLLHTFSGVIMGFIGFILIYKINYKFSMDINPLLVAIFSLTFAITIGVMWEILEFSIDIILGTANQKWNLPETEIMMGKPYQGSGLRDTMSDLIVDSTGSLITSIITYFMFKNKKKKVLEKLHKMIKDDTSLLENKDLNTELE